jgi:hypothetical protein
MSFNFTKRQAIIQKTLLQFIHCKENTDLTFSIQYSLMVNTYSLTSLTKKRTPGPLAY